MVQAKALWLAILWAAALPAAEASQAPPAAASAAPPSSAPGDPLHALWQARQAACSSSPTTACDQATAAVVAQLARAQWPSAQAYSRALAAEATAAPEPARALALARAALALGPTQSDAAWVHVRALSRNHAYGAAARAACVAAVQAVSVPQHWTLPAYSAARAAFLMLAVLALCALTVNGPQLAHDVAHLLPAPVRPYFLPLLALVALLGMAWLPLGPGLSVLAVAAITWAHMSVTWRAYLAQASMLCALALLLLVHGLQHTAAGHGHEALRLRALTDAAAPWAQASLPPHAIAQGDDLWAHALLARRRGDAPLAETLAERAISAGETHEALLVLEANLLWERADHARARAFLDQALSQAPEHALARYDLSVVLLSLADPKGAEAARNQAFADGGAALTEQVARAQASGQLLLDPELPERFYRANPSGAQEPLFALAWHSVAADLVGALSLPTALCMLFAWALCHGLGLWLPLRPALHDRLTQLVPVTGRCSRCQALSCPRCAKEAWDVGLCGPCQRAALGADDDALMLRDQQEAKSLTHYRVRQGLRRIVGWVVPGAALVWQRSALLGLPAFVLACSWLSAALYAWRLLPPPLGLWALPQGPGTQALAVTATLGAAVTIAGSLIAARRED